VQREYLVVTGGQVMGMGAGMMDDTRDRAEIYDLFNRYADAVAGHQWKLLDEVFTEDVTGKWLESPEIEGRAALVRRIRDVIEPTSETHLFGNYTAAIDGDIAEASVRVRLHRMSAGDPSRLSQKILGFFRARLDRTRQGWRFRHFGAAKYAELDAQVEQRSSTVGSGAGFPNRAHAGR
jgi:ketosteroid isomerase-like protein